MRTTASGVDDVIVLSVKSDDGYGHEKEQNVLLKELSKRPKYDVIFYTTAADYDAEFMRSFLLPLGRLVNTVEMRPELDEAGLVKRMASKVGKVGITMALNIKAPN